MQFDKPEGLPPGQPDERSMIRWIDLRHLLVTVCLGVAATTAQSAVRSPANAVAAAPAPDLSGLWMIKDGIFPTFAKTADRITRTLEGEPAPLQQWAASVYAQRIADNDRGIVFADAASRCLPNGIPLQMYSARYPLQILQSQDQITMLFEEGGGFRIVPMNRKLPENPDPTFMGQSVGRWEGDTLIIETIGLTTETTIDKLGLPHSEKLRVTERIRRVEPDLLENIITLEDPEAFTRPWSMRKTYARQPANEKILEYVCSENQRNSPDESGNSRFGR